MPENQLPDDQLPIPEYNGVPAYTIGSWKALPKYCCTKCKYDTLHRLQAIDHYIHIHLSDWQKETAPEPTRPIEAVLYGPDDKQILEVEVPVTPNVPLSDQEIGDAILGSLLGTSPDNKPGAQVRSTSRRSRN